MSGLLQDLRYATRLLAKNPAFSIFCIAILAIGIGANTAVYSIANGYMRHALPFHEPDRIMIVQQENRAKGVTGVASWPNFVDWRRESRSFERMAALNATVINLGGVDRPERLRGLQVTAGIFELLGVRPMLGRTIRADQERPGAAPTIILSHGLWERRFGSRADIVGHEIRLDGQRVTVAGVMPADFIFPNSQFEFWMPLATDESASARSRQYLYTFGRLAPGVSEETARAEMSTIGRRLERDYPEANAGWTVSVMPMTQPVMNAVGPALRVLTVAVAFVLLICCANLANLLLSRSVSRTKEVAIRTALGASRLRMLRQMLVEAVMLSLAGGVLGVLLASVGIQLLLRSVPPMFLPMGGIPLDARVLWFTVGVSVVTGCLFGVAPALHSLKTDLNDTLKQGGRTSVTAARGWLRNAFVLAEVSFAVLLLVGAGLLIRSYARLQAVDPGFRADHLLTMEITLPDKVYAQPFRQAAFFQSVLERTSALPGVRSAAVANILPLAGMSYQAFVIEGRSPSRPGEWNSAQYRVVSPGYFQTLGMAILRGRDLSRGDGAGAPAVAVINDALARRYWPDGDAVGRRIKLAPDPAGEAPWVTIAGIASNSKHMSLTGPPEPEVFVPMAQAPVGSAAVVVRTAGEPEAMAGSVRSAIAAIDPDQPVANVRTMERIIADSITPLRSQSRLLGVFAGAALLLAALGLYATISYSVSQRTPEIGMRLALGAERMDILRLILRRSFALTGIGIAIGLAISLALTRGMAALLYGVSAADPVVFVAVPVVLALVAAAAALLPARRATAIDPLIALRYE